MDQRDVDENNNSTTKAFKQKELKCRRIITFLIYFLFTHILLISFYYTIYIQNTLCLRLLIPILFYISYIPYICLMISNPGYVPLEEETSFKYTEVRKHI